MGGSFNVIYQVFFITYFLVTHFTYPTAINCQFLSNDQEVIKVPLVDVDLLSIVDKVHDCNAIHNLPSCRVEGVRA